MAGQRSCRWRGRRAGALRVLDGSGGRRHVPAARRSGARCRHGARGSRAPPPPRAGPGGAASCADPRVDRSPGRIVARDPAPRRRSRPRPRTAAPSAIAGLGRAGGLDAQPPRGVSPSHDRGTGGRPGTAPIGAFSARIDLHGALPDGGAWRVAPDIERRPHPCHRAVAAHHVAHPRRPACRCRRCADLATATRRLVTLTRNAAATVASGVVDPLSRTARSRDGDRVRRRVRPAPGGDARGDGPARSALSVATPPPLAEAARAASYPAGQCPRAGSAGRIVRLGRSGVGVVDLPRLVRRPSDGRLRPADARRVPGRDGVQPAVRDGHPRGRLDRRPGSSDGPTTATCSARRPLPGCAARRHHDQGRMTSAIVLGGASTPSGRTSCWPTSTAAPSSTTRSTPRRIANPIVVVIAPDAPPPPIPAGLEHQVVMRDSIRHGGPLAGLATGLVARRHRPWPDEDRPHRRRRHATSCPGCSLLVAVDEDPAIGGAVLEADPPRARSPSGRRSPRRSRAGPARGPQAPCAPRPAVVAVSLRAHGGPRPGRAHRRSTARKTSNEVDGDSRSP